MGRHSFVIPDGVKPRSGIHALICQWGKWIPDQVRHDNNSTSLRSQWHWIWKGDSSSQAPLEWQDKGNSVLIPTHQGRFFVASSSRMTGQRKQRINPDPFYEIASLRSQWHWIWKGDSTPFRLWM